jgi:hypothetical protein
MRLICAALSIEIGSRFSQLVVLQLAYRALSASRSRDSAADPILIQVPALAAARALGIKERQ